MSEETDGLVIKKDVKTKLSAERRAELGAEIAAHTIRYDELEEQKKLATKDLTAKMKAERADWTRKAKALRSGELEETVECTEHKDFARNEVVFRRIDTGEIVASRPMTGSDRQQMIDGVDAPVVNIDKAKSKKRLKAANDAAPEGGETEH